MQHFISEKVFKTVYKIIKNQRPFVDLPAENDLQFLNGINMGKLHSDKTCGNIAIHIETEMKTIICKNIIFDEKRISTLVDESTTFRGKITLEVVL